MKKLILDLEKTLINTSPLDYVFKRGGTAGLGLVVSECRLYDGSDKVIDRIKQKGIKLCIISKYGEEFSKKLLSIFGIPYDTLVLYDGKSAESYECALTDALNHFGIKTDGAISICGSDKSLVASTNLKIPCVDCKWRKGGKPFTPPALPDEAMSSPEQLISILSDASSNLVFYSNWKAMQKAFSTICQKAAETHLPGWHKATREITLKNNPQTDSDAFLVNHYYATEGNPQSAYKEGLDKGISSGKSIFPNEDYDHIVSFILSVKEKYEASGEDPDDIKVFWGDSRKRMDVTDGQFAYLKKKLEENGFNPEYYNSHPNSVRETAAHVIIELVSTERTVTSICTSDVLLKETCRESCFRRALGKACFTNVVFISLAYLDEALPAESPEEEQTSAGGHERKSSAVEAPRRRIEPHSPDDYEEVDEQPSEEEAPSGKDSFEVEGIKLDPDNPEFQYALQFALESNRNLYLTGKAGSGKTTFLKYLRQITRKKMVVLAPTGVAAMNAGGQTIHSFFQIAPSLYVPDDKRLRTKAPENEPDGATVYDNFVYSREKRAIIKNLELLVIDEVSMVRADLLDVVDTLLRVYRRSNLPFGGVQVILIGDAFQLPPVVRGEDRDLLMKYYESEFFFSARVIQRNKPLYIELKKIYRQNEQDFIDLLNRVRVNQMLRGDFRALDARVNPNFKPGEDDNYIILATKNDRVAEINGRKLEKLTTPLKTYIAEVTGDFPEGIRPTETQLELKVGAQVMFLKNDPDKRYYNGKIGVVVETGDNEVKVETEVGQGLRQVIVVNEAIWTNVVYHWDEENKCIVEEVIGSFKQYPLRLAWAITVHKSQGMTFEKVIADIGDSFASGQVYVALSRCTSMNGLVLTTQISPWVVKTDRRVLEFARNETPETLLTEQLSSSKADFYYEAARKAFRRHRIKEMLDNFYMALKYRNDISTDTFRRYISTWTEKLFGAEKDNVVLRKRIEEQDGQIEEMSAKVSDLQEQVASLKETVKSKDETIAKKEANLSDAKKSLAAKDKDLDSANERIKELHAKVNSLENKSQAQQEEIVRLSSITWLQKLFGKK